MYDTIYRWNPKNTIMNMTEKISRLTDIDNKLVMTSREREER